MTPALLATTGGGVVRLEPQGNGWRAARAVGADGARCVAAHPEEEAVAFAGGRRAGLWRTDDGGRSFRRLDLPEEDVFSVAVSPADGALYAGTEPSRLFRSRDGGDSWTELEALREIPSREEWSFPPRPHTSHVRSIAPSPRDPGILLAGIELGGVMRTADGGASWRDHPPGAVKDCHSLGWHPAAPGRVYEAGGGGTARSDDGGVTWRTENAGREWNYAWGLAPDPDDAGTWYASAAPSASVAHAGEGRARGRIHRWTGEGPWERLGGGDLPDPLDAFPYALLVAGDLLLAGLGDGRILVGEERGARWREAPIAGHRPGVVRQLVAI